MRGKRDKLIAVLMLQPTIILLAIFVYGFIGWTGYTSLTDSNAMQQLSGQRANVVGLQNYKQLFTGTLPVSARFRTDLVNSVFFTILFIAVCLGVGMLLAVLLDQKIKGESIFRTVFLFPMSLSFVVTGVVWKWLFNPQAGINVLPTYIGLPKPEFRWFISQEQWLRFNWQHVFQILAVIALSIIFIIAIYRWTRNRSPYMAGLAAVALLINALITLDVAEFLLTRPSEIKGFNLALIAIVIAAGWQMSGYTMAMYLAGLRGIPEEIREAARVDGASEFGVYRYVVFPLLAPITLSAIIILGHISLKIFDLVYVMGGGDNLFIDMPGINMFFITFRGQEFGLGAAIAIIMLILVAIVIIPYLMTQLRKEETT